MVTFPDETTVDLALPNFFMTVLLVTPRRGVSVFVAILTSLPILRISAWLAVEKDKSKAAVNDAVSSRGLCCMNITTYNYFNWMFVMPVFSVKAKYV